MEHELERVFMAMQELDVTSREYRELVKIADKMIDMIYKITYFDKDQEDDSETITFYVEQ